MSEAPKNKRQKASSGSAAAAAAASSSGGRVILNVGGTNFTTSQTTLTSSSAYFESLFSAEWAQSRAGLDGEDIFIDQDPEVFRVLLSYMRLGKIKASELTTAVMLQAQFLGMDRLLQAVRVVARREAFAGNTRMVFSAAKEAGITSDEDVTKEHTLLSLHCDSDCCFAEQDGRFLADEEVKLLPRLVVIMRGKTVLLFSYLQRSLTVSIGSIDMSTYY